MFPRGFPLGLRSLWPSLPAAVSGRDDSAALGQEELEELRGNKGSSERERSGRSIYNQIIMDYVKWMMDYICIYICIYIYIRIYVYIYISIYFFLNHPLLYYIYIYISSIIIRAPMIIDGRSKIMDDV